MFYECDNCKSVFIDKDLQAQFFICPRCSNMLFSKAFFYECPSCGANFLLNEKKSQKKCEFCYIPLRKDETILPLHCINCQVLIPLKAALKENNYSPFRCMNPKCRGIGIKKETKQIGPIITMIDRETNSDVKFDQDDLDNSFQTKNPTQPTMNAPENSANGDGSKKNASSQFPFDKLQTKKLTPYLTLLGTKPNTYTSLELIPNPCAFIGREQIIHLFRSLYNNIDLNWFSPLKEIKTDAEGRIIEEHFIIEYINGDYFIRDRNSPSSTFFKDHMLSIDPVKIKNNEEIIIPLEVDNQKIGLKLIFHVK